MKDGFVPEQEYKDKNLIDKSNASKQEKSGRYPSALLVVLKNNPYLTWRAKLKLVWAILLAPFK